MTRQSINGCEWATNRAPRQSPDARRDHVTRGRVSRRATSPRAVPQRRSCEEVKRQSASDSNARGHDSARTCLSTARESPTASGRGSPRSPTGPDGERLRSARSPNRPDGERQREHAVSASLAASTTCPDARRDHVTRGRVSRRATSPRAVPQRRSCEEVKRQDACDSNARGHDSARTCLSTARESPTASGRGSPRSPQRSRRRAAAGGAQSPNGPDGERPREPAVSHPSRERKRDVRQAVCARRKARVRSQASLAASGL
jgi:hypothetical protein